MKTLEEAERLYLVTNPQVIVIDGREILLRNIREDWFLTSAAQLTSNRFICICGSGFPVGPAMSMTASVEDVDSITIETAFEVSNRSAPQHAKGPSSEILTQRTEAHAITLHNAGTMAWAGLVQCDPRAERYSGLGRLPLIGGLFRKHQAARRTRDTVIFVTAQIIPELASSIIPSPQ